MAEKLSLRFVETENDLISLENLAKKVHFDCGLHDRRLQWLHSPGTFATKLHSGTHVLVIGRETQEVIGYFTGNYVRDDIYMCGQAYLDQQYRCHNALLQLTPRINAFMRPEIFSDNIHVFNNCNGISLKAAIRHFIGNVIGEKLITYEGEVNHEKLRHDLAVRLLNTEKDIEKLIAYDKIMHSLADREEFMRLWCTSDGVHATTAIALSPQGRCVGFASLRLATNLIEPAYADNDDIGLALLSTVLLTLPGKAIAQLTFPGQKRALLSFCSTLGWSSVMTEHRVYNKKNIDLPWKNVYASNDFFLL